VTVFLLPLREKVACGARRMRGARKLACGLSSNVAPTPLIRPWRATFSLKGRRKAALPPLQEQD